MVSRVAKAKTRKRRKDGRVKPPARASKRERAGWGSCWWICWSLRRATRACRAWRRRRLRSRCRDRRGWRACGEDRGRRGGEAARRHGEVAILDMGVSLVLMRASYLHCTKEAPALRHQSKRAEVELRAYEIRHETRRWNSGTESPEIHIPLANHLDESL